MIHDFSLDIETLSTSKNAVILSIGAAYLNDCKRLKEKHVEFPNTFYRVITVNDQIKWGRHIDYGTMKWWLERPVHVRNTTFEGLDTGNDTRTQMLGSAMIDLACWMDRIAQGEERNVWVKGVGFDGAIIESVYAGPGKMTDTLPITYRQWQEVRTLERLSGTKVDDFMRVEHPYAYEQQQHWAHHALMDAMYQGIFVADRLGHGYGNVV